MAPKIGIWVLKIHNSASLGIHIFNVLATLWFHPTIFWQNENPDCMTHKECFLRFLITQMFLENQGNNWVF